MLGMEGTEADKNTREINPAFVKLGKQRFQMQGETKVGCELMKTLPFSLGKKDI